LLPEVYNDFELCTGCKSCEIACAIEHSTSKDLFGAVFERQYPRKRIFVCAAAGQSIPLNCHHCEDAPCLHACPAGALYREENIVKHAGERCLGCGACQMACPFGVIARLPNSKVVAKCDGCPDRQTPACVDACPTGAVKFGDPSAMEHIRRQKIAQKLRVNL